MTLFHALALIFGIPAAASAIFAGAVFGMRAATREAIERGKLRPGCACRQR